MSENQFSNFSRELRASTARPVHTPPRSWQRRRQRIIMLCAGLTVAAAFVMVRAMDTYQPAVEPEKAAASVIETIPFTGTSTVTGPDVVAQALYINNMETGQVVYENSSYVRWPLASLTKLVTAAVALEQLGPDMESVISETAVASEGQAGSFRVGERFSVRDLIIAMMTVSSNDAATAVAEAYDALQLPTSASGGTDSVVAANIPISKTAYFTEQMQRFAKRIGMRESVFGDPTGLSPINQTTAPDIALLVRYISLQHPDIFIPSRRKTNTITELGTKKLRDLTNINQFAGREDFVGGKTGYTDEARGNLVSVFNVASSTYSIVLLGTTNNRFTETLTAYTWLKQQLND